MNIGLSPALSDSSDLVPTSKFDSSDYLRKNERVSLKRRYLRTELLRLETGLWPAEIERCAADVIYFINQWLYTFDPRDLRVWPFDLFPQQSKFICLVERQRESVSSKAASSRSPATWGQPGFAVRMRCMDGCSRKAIRWDSVAASSNLWTGSATQTASLKKSDLCCTGCLSPGMLPEG